MKVRNHSLRRRRTGRTAQINTNIKPEAYTRLRELADELTEREGRLVSMAEIIERSLQAFEKKHRSASN